MALIKISELPIGDSNISSGDMLPFVNHETLQTQRLTVQGLEDYLNVAGLIDSAISQFDQDGDGSDHDSARTQGQIDSAIGALTTSDIPEGTNLYYTDARVTTLVDSAYVSARVEADLTLDVLDSAEAIQLINETVDSAYVNALVDFPGGDDGHDSARVQGQIDSAISSALPDGNSGSTLHYDGNGWVPTDNILIPTNARPQLRFQPSGALLTMDSAQVQFSSLNVTTFSHPTYGAQLTLQGQSGDPSRLTTVEVRAQNYHDLSGNDIITTTVDSAYVQARVTLDGTHDSALVQGQIDSSASNYLQTTAYGFDNTVDSATINKLTVGPDSADDAKLYFETGAGTHVLEGREAGAVDMNSWVSYDNAPQAGWRGLAYGDGKWIAVGERDSDRMMSSTDGINWTAIPVGPDYNYRDILYDGSKWVALAWSRPDGGNERIQTSTDGVTWSGDAVITTTQSGGNWSSIAYDGTRYVAVGGYYGGNPAPGLIGYSTDAVNWTLATYTGNWLQSVVYADGQFVAVGISGACATSSDGVTWTQRTAPSNSWASVAYGNDVWVAVSYNGTTRAMTSSDGVTWTLAPQYSVFEYDWQSITYGDGKFVAVSNNGSQRVMWSTNGTSWIAQTIPSKVWYSIDYAAGKFVGVGNTTQVLILEHDTSKAGLFYDGELVATTENLRPLLEKLAELSDYDFDAAQLDFSNLQDSAGGLASGKLYRDSDTVRIVL